jgi:hypothetical protein
MNIQNIALELEQTQRIVSDRLSVEVEIDKDTELYLEGQCDAAWGIDPVHPENLNYWKGYCEEKRHQWVKLNNPLPDELYQKSKQGYLRAGCHNLSQRYGKISPINDERDLKGWAIEIEGLEIWILTFDWEEAEKEIKWTIYSHHLDSLKLLSKVFGQDNVIAANFDTFGDVKTAA